MSKLPPPGGLQKRTSLGGIQQPATGTKPATQSAQSGNNTPLQKKAPASRLSLSSLPGSRISSGVAAKGSVGTPAKRPAGAPQPTRWQIGEPVLVEALGVSGTLRFLGTTQFKSGIWAGVELDPEYKGKGKNDGSVGGIQYFECEPANGIFILVTKLSRPAGSEPIIPAAKSTISSPSKKPAASKPAMTTSRSSTGLRRPSSASSISSVESDKYAPSAAERAAIATGRITAGSRASRYVGVTANQLRKGPLRPPPGAPALPRSTSPTKSSSVSTRARQSLGPRSSMGRLSLGGSSLPAPTAPNRRSSIGSQSDAGTPTSPTKPMRVASSQRISRPSSAASEQADTQQLHFGKMSNKALSSKISEVLSRSGDDSVATEPLLSMFDQQAARIDQLTTKIEVLEENNARLAKEKKEADVALKNAQIRHENELNKAQEASKSNVPETSPDEIEKVKLQHAAELMALQEELHDVNQSRSNAASEAESSLKAEIERLEHELALARNTENLDALKVTHADQLHELHSQLADSKEAVSTQQQAHEKELADLHEKLRLAEKAPVIDIAAHEEALSELRSTHAKEIEATRAELTQASMDPAVHEYEIASLKAAHQAEIDALRHEIVQTKDAVKSNTDNHDFEAERGQLLEQHSKLLDEMNDLQQLLEHHKVENSNLKEEIAGHLSRAAAASSKPSDEIEQLKDELSEKTADLESVQSTLDRIQGEHDKEVGKMNDTIKELRSAGKEAIEAYESKIIDLESIIDQLKVAGQESIELLQESEKRKSGAIEVHAQIMKRNASLEGQLGELKEDLARAHKHIEEAQANGQADADGLDQLHDELERAIDMEVRLREEIEDLTSKLDQSLESEMQAKQEIVVLSDELNETRKRITRLERDRPLMGDNKAIADQSLLNENRDLQLELSQRLNEMEEMKKVMEEINAKNERLKAERRKERESWSTENEALKSQLDHLRRFSAPASPGVSSTSSRIGDVNSNEQRSSLPATAKRDSFNSTMSTRKEESQQILGLKHIIQELTKENLEVTQQNKLLIEETEELRKAQTALEVNVERLMADLEGLNGLGGDYEDGEHLYTAQVDEIRTVDEGDAFPASVDELRHEVRRLQREVTEKQALMDRLSAKHSQEIGALREKMTDIERKAAREVNALNKEVAELETLVESKIFKEDELEMKILELKKELRSAREGLSGGITANHSRVNGSISTRHSGQYSNGSNTPTAEDASSRAAVLSHHIEEEHDHERASEDENLYCELCDEHGHDVLGCTKTWNNAGTLTGKPVRGADERPYCENCEEEGLHWTEDCPNQDETF